MKTNVKILGAMRVFGMVALSVWGMRAAAQSIPNPSFENWTKSGLFGTSLSPDDWYGLTFKVSSLNVDASKPSQSKDAYDGNYAAGINTTTMNRITAAALRPVLVRLDTTGTLDSLLDLTKPSPGILTNATIQPIPFLVNMLRLTTILSDSMSLTNISSLAPLIEFVSGADFGAMFDGGLGVHGVPHRLTGYYKYSVGNNQPDTADQGVALMLCLATDTLSDTVPRKVLTGGGLAMLQPTGEYAKFSLDYLHYADYYPDTVVFMFLSSLTTPVEGSQLLVDNLEFSYFDVDTVKDLTLDSVKHDCAYFHWSRSKSFLWQIACGPAGSPLDSMTVASSMQPKYTVSGLAPKTTYDVYVRSMFGLNMYGPWTPAYTFATTQKPCDYVRGFQVAQVTDSSALLQWSANLSLGYTYHLQCALAGDTLLLADTLLQSDSFALLSLLPDTAYVARMQVICPDTASAWKEISFRTLSKNGEGVQEAESWHAAVYPNPSKGDFFVEIPEGETVRMFVFTLSGQCVIRQELTQNRTSCRLPAPGTYFVRLSSEKGSLVRKVVALP